MKRLRLRLALAATFLIFGLQARAQNFDAAGSVRQSLTRVQHSS